MELDNVSKHGRHEAQGTLNSTAAIPQGMAEQAIFRAREAV